MYKDKMLVLSIKIHGSKCKSIRVKALKNVKEMKKHQIDINEGRTYGLYTSVSLDL